MGIAFRSTQIGRWAAAGCFGAAAFAGVGAMVITLVTILRGD
jgi:hypothetical protein